MVSKRVFIIIAVFLFFVIGIISIFISNRRPYSNNANQVGIFLIAPIQDCVTISIRFLRDLWEHYFYLASVSKKNIELKKKLDETLEKINYCDEIQSANERLRNLLDFRQSIPDKVMAAEVIGKDPFPWFRTIIIDKGKKDSLTKGLPVVVSEGIVGQLIDVSTNYSKVLLIIDQNSAVDGLVQRTRARGIIKGISINTCYFKYVLRKNDVEIDDIIVSSGLDGVYPKGIRIGRVSKVIKGNAGIFQDVEIDPYVDFEKLEEVFVIFTSKKTEFNDEN
ncbi:MAG: rod shape-determining protein MreC [Desulfobacterales bacterium]|nr:rod shape-determining protein MreC [Desulfobacterales bacterium]